MPPDAEITAESLASHLREIAQKLGKKSISRSEFLRETSISMARIYKHFDSWNELVVSAGLEPIDVSRIEDDDLFEAMKEAFLSAGKICTQIKFEKLCRYSITVYKKRGWGNWTEVLARFREWAALNATDFPFSQDLPVTGSISDAPLQPDLPKSVLTSWSAKGGRQYGSF